MGHTMPLFPLGDVLFPGLVLPLHIFEQRYRQLVRDLQHTPTPRQFGVIAIREGSETGAGAARTLYQTGCTATVRRICERDDGCYDLVSIGTERFRLLSVDQSGEYLRGEVELLDDTSDSAGAQFEADAVRAAFQTYLEVLIQSGMDPVSVPEPPQEPVTLSYFVASCVIADLPDRQSLLEQPDATQRLAAERALLSRETAMLRSLPSTPAPELRYSPYSPN